MIADEKDGVQIMDAIGRRQQTTVINESRAAIMLFLCLFAANTVSAANKPCSQSKGGIKYCEGEKFICNDGSVSASKQKCSVAKFGTKDAAKSENPVTDKKAGK